MSLIIFLDHYGNKGLMKNINTINQKKTLKYLISDWNLNRLGRLMPLLFWKWHDFLNESGQGCNFITVQKAAFLGLEWPLWPCLQGWLNAQDKRKDLATEFMISWVAAPGFT